MNQNFRPKSKYLVEDCYSLSLHQLGKKLLWPERVGKVKIVTSSNGQSQLKIAYAVNSNSEGKAWINISYVRKKSNEPTIIKNIIEIDEEVISYGIRPFLVCDCGRRCNKLYLRPSHDLFACRHCLNLVYELTTINKDSLVGSLSYKLIRAFKLDDANAKVRCITYNGKLTRRARRVVAMAGKW